MVINLTEIKENIIEEVHDAVKYMNNAVEYKDTEWGEYFCMMSKNELEHANILLKMFNKIKKPESVTDAEYAKMHKDIMETYTTDMSKVESLKKIYWSK